jgi:hypothetical protein
MVKLVPAFIDPPSPFTSLKEWQDFRDEMERLAPCTPAV